MMDILLILTLMLFMVKVDSRVLKETFPGKKKDRNSIDKLQFSVEVLLYTCLHIFTSRKHAYIMLTP